LRDFVLWAQTHNPPLQMVLHVRSTTTFSADLQTLINNGTIFVKYIPGM
jgi:hypothetical protein